MTHNRHSSLLLWVLLFISGYPSLIFAEKKITIAQNTITSEKNLLPVASVDVQSYAWVDTDFKVNTASNQTITPLYTLDFEKPFSVHYVKLNETNLSGVCAAFDIIKGKKNSCLRITCKPGSSEQNGVNALVLGLDPQRPQAEEPTHLLFWIRSDCDYQPFGVAYWNKKISGRENLNLLDLTNYKPVRTQWHLFAIPVEDGNYYHQMSGRSYVCFFPLKNSNDSAVYIDNIQFCRVISSSIRDLWLNNLSAVYKNHDTFVNRTGHFDVYSDYSEYICFQSGRCCEMVFKDLGMLFDHPIQIKKPVITAIFSRQSDFKRFLKLGGYKATELRAVYLNAPDFSFIGSYVDDTQSESDVYTSLVHETAHLFLHQHIGSVHIPLWLDEGIAQYYEISTSEYGNIARERKKLKDIRKYSPDDTKYSLKALLTGFNTRYDADRIPIGAKYFYSYSFVSFLYKTQTIGNVIQSVKNGNRPEAALRSIFGCSIEDIDRKWKDFVGKKTK